MTASLCSGCAALLNQVLWTRILSLVFGSTIEAVSGVTAVFMAGLALGSALAPRLVNGKSSAAAMVTYSRIEFSIAACSVVLALVLPSLENLRVGLGVAPVWVLAVVLLLIPAGLMGTTLVTQSHALTGYRDPSSSSRASGLLFAANTFGAMLGVYGSVLFLVPAFGVRKSIFVAASLNIVAGLTARLGVSPAESTPKRSEDSPVSMETRATSAERKQSRRAIQALQAAPPRQDPVPPDLPAGILLAALFVAGFAGLANEVVWTRAFILVAGPTAHAFAFVLGAIVLGLATGALVSSVAIPFLRDQRLAFAVVQAGVAVASAFIIKSFAAMPVLYGEAVRRLVDQPQAIVTLQASRSLFLLFPAAALSGALFPLGLQLLRPHFTAAQAMGYGSASNTLGAILGALGAGYALLPQFGMDWSLRLVAIASAISSMAVALQGRRLPRIIGLTAGVVAVAFVLNTPFFDQELFAGGAYKYSAYDLDLPVEEVLRRGELLSYAEGRTANVSVKRVGDALSLAVDGKVDATSGADMVTQRLLAHVPFLVHESPQTALVIGLGSGVTVGSAMSHDPKSVTAVEISPEVVSAAKTFFSDANGHVLDDPRLKLIVGDARQTVLSTTDRFDVIISEPSNPWMAGVSALFTREFFQSVKARLNSGGVFCQWGHLYNMGEADLATLLSTFADVFPRARIFMISEADILIVSGEQKTALNPRRIKTLKEGPRRDLASLKILPEILLAIPTVELLDLVWLRDAKRHTDDAPVLDFSAPLSIHAQTAAANRHRLVPVEVAQDVSLLKARLALLTVSASADWGFEVAQKAIENDATDLFIVREYVKNALRLHRTELAEATLRAAQSRKPRSTLLVGQALIAWNTGRAPQALALLEEAFSLDPKEVSAYLLAAEIQSSAGELQSAKDLVRRVLAIEPRNAEAIGLAAEAAFKEGEMVTALRLASEALVIDAAETRSLELNALALAQMGRAPEARRAFSRMVAVSPDAATARINFGVFELQQGNAEVAARLFEDAIDLDPSNVVGYRGLRDAAVLLNRPQLMARADRGLARLTP